ncbi:MAG TPA: zf-HC2 domain-containing protein, partial [Polyangia bacterium]
MPCPTEDTLFQLVTGELAGEAVAALEQHLDTCAECWALFEAVGRSLCVEGGPLRPPGDDAGGIPEELAPGCAVDRFIVLYAIGAGGMGRVYAAYDPKLDRRVALKFLHPWTDALMDAAALRARLLSEAQALAKL